jgi:hypothetical protein
MKRSIILAVSLLFAACGSQFPQQEILLRSPEGEELSLQVEIADTPEQREQGLMHRKSLSKNAGMLFLLPEEAVQSFWMKNTLIPLDILYFDANGVLVSVRQMEPCVSDPCPAYSSGIPALYALELNAGATERLGIGAGWTLVPPVIDQTSPDTPAEQNRP